MDQLFVTLMSELLHQTGLLDLTLGNLVMIIAGCVLLYLGIIKKYEKPFSKEQHEALGVADFHLAQWKDGRVVKLDDAVVKGLTAADLKR